MSEEKNMPLRKMGEEKNAIQWPGIIVDI